MNSDMQKKTFIADFKEGQYISDLMLVSRKNLAETKAGKPYLALTMMDKSGDIEARIWDNAARFDALTEVGKIVVVDGQVKAFRDQLQLSISSLKPAPEGSIPLDNFMPTSKRSAEEMQTELAQLIDTVQDPFLHNLLTSIFRGDLLQQFSTAPAAKMMHHAYLGGLLEHSLSVTGLAQHISQHYLELDRDLLITGALLHDIGKIREFSFSTVPFDYTDSGRLIGHLVLGSEMVRRQAGDIPNFPQERLDQLIHLILSHHGKHEFGSPCLPMTIEAILLHHLDDMDAKVNYIGKLSESVDSGAYQWSDFQRPLERFLLLRGTPEDAITPQENINKVPVHSDQESPYQDTQTTRDTDPPASRKAQKTDQDNKTAPDPSSGQQTLF